MIKTIKVYPTEKIPALQQGTDRSTVPFRWLESLVNDIKRSVPTDEQNTCMFHGVENLTATYEHRLTDAEIQAEKTIQIQSILSKIKADLPQEGIPMSADQVAELKKVLQNL